MSSNIDPLVPIAGLPTTLSVRNNFSTAKIEIEALQASTSSLAGRATTLETNISAHNTTLLSLASSTSGFSSLSINPVDKGAISSATPVDSTAAVQAAWNAASANGGKIVFPNGEYWFNVIFENKDRVEVDFGGSIIHPFVGTSAVINVRALTGNVQNCTFKNGRFNNQAAFTASTAIGILISGVDDTKFNDFNTYENLTFDGFYHGMSVTHRAIWNHYLNIDIVNSLNIGFKVVTAYSFNANTFFKVRSYLSQLTGIYIEHTTGTAINNNFYDCNPEGNGANTAGLLNAGLHLRNCESTSIVGGYFESNGVGALDGRGAAIRIDGTYGMNISIKGAQAWGSTYAVDNRATLSQGTYDCNRWGSGIVHIELGTGVDNAITIGANYGGTYVFVDDVNGNNHVLRVVPDGFVKGSLKFQSITAPITLTSSTTGTSMNLSTLNYVNSGLSEVQLVAVSNVSSITFVSFTRTGAGEFYMPNFNMYTASPGDTIRFYYTSTPTVFLIPR